MFEIGIFDTGSTDLSHKLGPVDPTAGWPAIFRGATMLRQLSVLPQPVQSPHPPIWEPFAKDRSIRYAASYGLNGNFSIHDQYFAEEIMPELRRECGGAPELPDTIVDLEPQYSPAGA